LPAFKYKTVPFVHQRKAFTETANLPAYGLLWSPGVGKSKPLIDTAAYLFQQGKISAVIVVAPNGVHRNWVTDELPSHMPLDVMARTKTLIWKASTFKTQKFQSKLKDMMRHDGLAFLVVAYESCITDNFKKWIKRFVDERPTLMILDESHRIKTANSKVKTSLIALGNRVPYRRIATGTPLERAFDLYPQLRFLDSDFWKNRGLSTYEDFKHRYGIFVQQSFGARSFEKLVDHKNLDELSDAIKQITWRLTKEQAGLNLPPKVYTRRYTELTPEQSRVYNELKDKHSVRLQSGDLLEAEMAMTRLLRLQQIVCGYVACEAEQPVQRIDPKRNPRMDLCCDEILEGLPHQAIVFSRFTEDIQQMCDRLGKQAVRYDGKVDEAGRARAKLAFQKGDAKYFIASEAGSEGLTLVGAKTMIFFANNYKLIRRLQQEDRCHRIGQTESVLYIDIVAPGTVDEMIVDNLRQKFDIASRILSDEIRAWL
jgi:Mesyanzhinovviridae DNA helicase